jgi:nicotinate-nucleotide adenylyltransferase
MIDLAQCRCLLLFGGSFDPPHRAHVALPTVVMTAIGADAVAYIPCAIQPLKQGRPVTEAHHRLRMLELALQDQPHALILTDELDRAQENHRRGVQRPSYTVDTLEALRQRLGEQVVMRLLIGMDQFRVFDQWKSPGRIVELAEPVVMARPPEDERMLSDVLPHGYELDEWRPRVVPAPRMDISSTTIRDRVRQGLPIADLVPPAVEQYIREHGLYR